MKIESGRYYRCRNKRKAFVDCIKVGNPFAKKPIIYPVIGYVEGFGSCIWTSTGLRFDGGRDALDLVAEWQEPVSKTVWLHLVSYSDGVAILHPRDELHSDNQFTGTLLAVKQITITEGEGLPQPHGANPC